MALLAAQLALAQADYAREKRWADEITPAILVVDPVQLDLFGEKDNVAVLDFAKRRAAAIRGIRDSGQASIASADHFFTGMESELVRQVRLFLDRRLK